MAHNPEAHPCSSNGGALNQQVENDSRKVCHMVQPQPKMTNVSRKVSVCLLSPADTNTHQTCSCTHELGAQQTK